MKADSFDFLNFLSCNTSFLKTCTKMPTGVTIMKYKPISITLDIIKPRIKAKPNQTTANGLKIDGMIMVVIKRTIATLFNKGNVKNTLAISNKIKTIAKPVSPLCCLVISW